MYTKNDNKYIETDDINNELSESFFKRYQKGLETKNEGKNERKRTKEVILFLKVLIYCIIAFIE